MDTILSTMFYFWITLFVAYFLMQRGLWIFSDVAKGTVSFMLEKALGPGADLVEGRPGAGARSWIMQGSLWMIFASMFTFTSMWLTHDPDALHSLASWGYTANAEELASAGVYATLYGTVSMFIIGCSFHIIPKLAGTELASETNANLVSFVWTISVLVLVIGSQNNSILGIDIIPLGVALNNIVLLAVIMNQLLTVANKTRNIATPGWLILIALLSSPILAIVSIVSGAANDNVGQWLTYHIFGGTFFFAGVAGIALYASSIASGNPLWSKTLVGVTLIGSIFTINPFGDVDGQMVMDAFGPLADNNVMSFTNQDMLSASFLMALVSIPVLAFSSNMLVTMRGSDMFVDDPDASGNAELNLGSWLIIPIVIGSLFVQTDAVSGTNELLGISNSLSVMAGWLVLVPLSLGAALSLYPELVGRHLFSQNRARWGFWMMTGGAIFGLSITMIADFMDIALAELLVEDSSNLSEELRKVGSVMFYGVVIGSILHTLNMVTGMFRGELISKKSVRTSSISVESYSLVSPTTIRRILSSGADLDTEVIPTGENDEKGSATKL
ncbi:MAG TPA: hypothetical protein HA357_05090 [Candidatus Thalassarchaeaceae archaeon]|jgi:hypothetical protein|nr:hypothetical protein [Euryarchaeota archaeon]DAC61773.1 MAG TPA: hypothetical protein D7I02_05080 [Candidatus Poseidoniales archaeon]HII13150.1 hypothetical protein [Candidatus Thalassarchaeaceae archaeon]MBT3847559.1 hypothetical protein [Euryarchaeota archaeon]MBT4156018.1 hypothetical protein [Euryarchaeota archaeon]